MSAAVSSHRINAGPFVVVCSVVLIGLVLLPAAPARADDEKSIFGDVAVERGERTDGVSTIFGDVRVRGDVAGNVNTATGNVKIDAPVAGSVNSGFGDVRVNKPVEGEVDAGFGNVYVSSRVGGIVDADHGDVHAFSGAELASGVRAGNGEVIEHPGSAVRGTTRAGMMPDFGSDDDGDILGFVGWFLATAGFVACVVLAVVTAPRTLLAAARRAEESPGRSLFLGLASIPAVLVLCVALAVSVIGVPVLLLIAPAYLALVFFGALVAAFFVGRKVVLATGRHRSGNALAAALGAVLISAATLIPFLGNLLLFGLAFLGTGAAILTLISSRRAPRVSYPSYEAYVYDRRDA